MSKMTMKKEEYELSDEQYQLIMSVNDIPRKHPKVYTQVRVCTNCGFKMMYKCKKCPSCDFIIKKVVEK